MKNLLFFFLFVHSAIFAQVDSLTTGKYIFAKETFGQNYKPAKYPKYKGSITIVDNNTIRYGDKILTIPNLNQEYKTIFTSGLFHPELIVGNSTAIIKSMEEIEDMTTEKRILYNSIRNDSIHIAHYFDELRLLNPNPQTKRFVFWLLQKGFINPTEYYFELYNPKATKHTPIKEFIAGAKLTFIYRGTIIL